MSQAKQLIFSFKEFIIYSFFFFLSNNLDPTRIVLYGISMSRIISSIVSMSSFNSIVTTLRFGDCYLVIEDLGVFFTVSI